MRPFREDIVGQTDANGNASIPIKLPQTGEWHNVKFALNIGSYAEWAIVVSGTTVTYGRGRRVTLGPELIQDGETVTVNVTGALANQPITNSAATGVSGTPAEMLSSHAPQPNSIAMEIASLSGLLYQVALTAGGFFSSTVFQPHPLLQSIVVLITAGSGSVTVTGQGTGKFQTQQATGPGQLLNFPTSIFGQRDFDPLGILIAVFGTVQCDVFMQLGSMVTPVNRPQNPLFVQEGNNPAAFQSPASSFASGAAGFSVAGGGTQGLIAGVGGQTITLLRIKRFANASNSVNFWEDTGSAETVWTDIHSNAGSDSIECSGLKLPLGAGLQFRNVNATATGTIWATVHYTQG